MEKENKIERLTKRGEDGRAHYAKMPDASYLPTFYEELDALNSKCLERLCEFEDKIESGQLVER